MPQSESVFLGDGSSSGDLLLIVAPILWSLVSMFVVHCLFVLNSFAINFMGKRELVALLCLSSCVLWLIWLCCWSLRCCWCDCGISLSCSHDFYSCVALILSQQAESHYLFFIQSMPLKFSKKECRNSTM